LVTAARQQLSHEWWALRRAAFEVCVSELVIVEAAAGDPDAADRRAQFIRDIVLLSITDEAVVLAQKLVEAARLPTRAGADALHISVAAVHGIDYLLTWNSTHIANAEFRPKVEQACRNSGFEPPVLCTPDELMGS
jgi:predicted nucleic acid-binding protein